MGINTPLEKDKFINLERTPPMIPEISLYINTGIVCTLHFLLDTLQIIFSTSSWSVGIQTKECGKLVTKESGSTAEPGISLFKFTAIVLKYLFHSFDTDKLSCIHNSTIYI